MTAAMHAVTAQLFAGYRGEVSVFQPLPNCFEHFGLDFMVDERLHVWLLEVNPGPDFKQTGAELQGVVARMLDASVTVALDRDLAASAPCPAPATNAADPSAAPLPLLSALDEAKLRTRGTGFHAIYADNWQSGRSSSDDGNGNGNSDDGRGGMKMY